MLVVEHRGSDEVSAFDDSFLFVVFGFNKRCFLRLLRYELTTIDALLCSRHFKPYNIS